MSSLSHIGDQLARYRPRRVPGRRQLARAAVAVVLAPGRTGPSVLLVRRAERAGDPWSGDVAFPGGRLEPTDRSACAAACRESVEEIGLALTPQDCIGRLSDRLTRTHRYPLPMVVSPFVFGLTARHERWQLNHEIEEALWLPLDYLAQSGNRQRMWWRVGPLPLPLPRYDYRGRRLWGLTLMMLDELRRVIG